ncbi:bisanhydrobacterioruberin hydratase [Halobium salinum]|uniref:Bisanhydrobacterioruberin hydratase n=1 Tax=Halobium salinum TaxID=1364940 RepID=A0ABD5P8G9_9EURY|nr:bisanhydrobacterioruberin hydratase [Halobium salinum]
MADGETSSGRSLGGLRERLPSDRFEAERLADDLVREHRFEIAVVFPLVGAVLLLASAEGLLPEPLAFNPWLVLSGVLVMRSPLLAGVFPLMTRRATAGVLALCGYAYAVEYVGIQTGFPYGEFYYGVDLGPTVGGVPLGLPVFFLPLVMNAYLLCLLLLGPSADSRARRLVSVILVVLLMDVVLDPGAVALGFWVYPNGGAFYGVPLSNYAGWVVSATLTVFVMDAAFDHAALRARLERCAFMLDDLVSFVILWGGVNAVYGNWIPVLVAVGLGAGLLRTERFDADLLGAVGVGR